MEDGLVSLSSAFKNAVPVVIGIAALVVYVVDARRRQRETEKLRDELERVRAQDVNAAKGVESFLRPRLPRPRILSWGFVVASALVAFGVVWAAAYQRSLVTELMSQGDVIEEARELVQTAERGINELVEQNQSLSLQLASIKQEERGSAAPPPPATPRAGPSQAKPSQASDAVRSRAESPPRRAMAQESTLSGTAVPNQEMPGRVANSGPSIVQTAAPVPATAPPQSQPSIVQTAAPVPAAAPSQPQPKTSPRPRPGFSFPHFMEDTSRNTHP